MGKIAEALRANLQAIAQSDARSLKELDQELSNATATAPTVPPLKGRDRIAALLGKGSFQQQTVATLKRLCRDNGITGYSKLRKADLAASLNNTAWNHRPGRWRASPKGADCFGADDAPADLINV